MSNGEFSFDDDDDDFCDISEFNRDDLLPYRSSTGQLPFNVLAISEASLKEDIEKVNHLRIDEVRWFYYSNKIKAWKSFVGYDSLRLEKQWRSKNVKETVHEPVCVRGGMFEVDLSKMKCLPIYWPSIDLAKNLLENGVAVIRGTWFYDVSWQPLDPNLASRIEAEHTARWKGYNISHIKELMDNKVMHSMQLQSCHVEWKSVTDVVLYKDATAHRALRNIATKFGVSKATTSGQRLRRGYREDAMENEKSPPITNLIFVVHGIGAKSDRCKIVRNTGMFRAICRRLEMKHFGGRTEFIPIEWRSKVKLDGDMVECITPKKGQGMRKFVNNTAMDIFYYTSPRYRSEIISGLQSELNKIYQMFAERNPTFRGKVSVFAHSLGSVIFHDILTERASIGPGKRSSSSSSHSESIGGLAFKPDNLFCVGSPLGMFMCLRGFTKRDECGSVNDIVPTSLCRKLYNIYHPADPVAYRLEPLIYKNYSEVAPLQIASYASFLRNQSPPRSPSLSARDKPTVPEGLVVGDSASDESPSNSPRLSAQPSYLRSMSNAVTGSAVRLGRDLWSKARGSNSQVVEDSGVDGTTQQGSSSPKLPIREVAPADRVDYELQEGFTERKLGYASFTSHTSYWTNQDLGMFVMSKLHGDVQPRPI